MGGVCACVCAQCSCSELFEELGGCVCLLYLGFILCLCPFCVCFLGIGIIFSECHSVQDSLALPNLPGLVVLFLHLSSLLVTLSCWTSPIYLYFQVKISNFSSRKKVEKITCAYYEPLILKYYCFP